MSRDTLAATIMAALNEHGASYRLPRDPSDLAYLVADAVLQPPPEAVRERARGPLRTALIDYLGLADESHVPDQSADLIIDRLDSLQFSALATQPPPEPDEPYGHDVLLELAWGVIVNAGHGDWTQETPEWQEAAARWRDRYHRWLDPANTAEPPRPTTGVSEPLSTPSGLREMFERLDAQVAKWATQETEAAAQKDWSMADRWRYLAQGAAFAVEQIRAELRATLPSPRSYNPELDHFHDPFDPMRHAEWLSALGHKPLADGRCEHRWRNRTKQVVRCSFLDGYRAALSRPTPAAPEPGLGKAWGLTSISDDECLADDLEHMRARHRTGIAEADRAAIREAFVEIARAESEDVWAADDAIGWLDAAMGATPFGNDR